MAALRKVQRGIDGGQAYVSTMRGLFTNLRPRANASWRTHPAGQVVYRTLSHLQPPHVGLSAGATSPVPPGDGV